MASTPVLLEFTCGACDALDDFTSYLTPDKLEDLYAMIDGNFVGLGVELKINKEGLLLVGVIRGGPAWEAGIKAGETIVKIGGRSIKGLGLDEAANRLQGSEGTTLDLEVKRRDGTLQAFRLVRRHVDVESVAKVGMVESAEGIGYLRLTGFQKTSADEIDKAVGTLASQGMRALVLDLRGNPGGLLNVAVEIAERFIDSGLIVSTRGRAQGQTQALSANGRARWRMPLYVLVDHDSASASEILAGALQDHRRATIMGARTYGKGSVQSIFSLRSAPAGLKLTTAKFYSPLNRPYSEQGVQPDIPIKLRSAAKPDADGSIPSRRSELRRPPARSGPGRGHPHRQEPAPRHAVSQTPTKWTAESPTEKRIPYPLLMKSHLLSTRGRKSVPNKRLRMKDFCAARVQEGKYSIAGSLPNERYSKEVQDELRDLCGQVARLQRKIHDRNLEALVPWIDALRHRSKTGSTQ